MNDYGLPGPNPPRNARGGFRVVDLGAYGEPQGYPTVGLGERNLADCRLSPCGHTLKPQQWKPSLARRQPEKGKA